MIDLPSIKSGQIPRHIAIIMDGNGRWAKKKGKARIFGHQNALESVRHSIEGCIELGVEYLTLYAFSTENWNRPKREVNALMNLLVTSIYNELPELMKSEVKLSTIGQTKSLPKRAQNGLRKAIEKTKDNKKIEVILALSYSSKWEILEAVKNMITDAKDNKLTEKELSEEVFGQYLTTAGIPDPELMIRTSGERRISNFLLWQLAYSEFIFIDKLWPDFRKDDLYIAISDFQGRERRFGKTGEQIKQKVNA